MRREFASDGEPVGGPAPTTLVEIVLPGDTNHHGTLFGGAGLAFMDRTAFIAAARHGRMSFVTASCERVDFKTPARSGEIIAFTGRPVWAGRRSVTVEVEMVAEAIVGGERRLCTRAMFHMLAMPDERAEPDWSLPSLPEAWEVSSDDTVRMTDIVFADQANSLGKMFGGEALAQMTRAAFVAASRYSRQVTVLASSERIDFRHPVAVGAIIDVFARVTEVGRTSMRIEAELWSETLLTGERRLTARGVFVMVAVDGENRPVPVVHADLDKRAS